MSDRWHVLVVDDEPVVCDSIRLVLEHEGLTVASVADAESALAHPALATCRLLICDLMLPAGSGLEVVRSVRQQRPDLPIVLITGYATAGNAGQALEAGATEFLAKPFDDTELLTLVRRALGRADLATEEERP